MPDTTQFTTGNDPSQMTNALKANFILHNRYKIMGVLGGGGMGTVYQARDLNFTDVKRLVAIKEMHSLSADPALRGSMMKTFQREANILATLSHPAIPKILDFFDLNDRAYLVMEYINGSDLEMILSKTREIPVDTIITWAIELCDVLQYLHEQKPAPIVFRDMKPSNVMIDALHKVRLIDFGIAKAFVSGAKNTMIGTEGYSAPEQYKGDVSPQSDIYSLGATLHHLLTRKDPRLEPPFSFYERPIQNHNPNASPSLVAVVMKALNHKPEDRYKSCAEMKEALEKLRYQPMIVAAPQVEAPPQAPALAPSAGAVIPPAAAPMPAVNTVSASQPATATDFFDDEPNKETGTVQPRWKFKTEDEIRCNAVVYRDMALIGSYDSNIWALKLDTGQLVWKSPTKGGIASSPIIDESNRLVMFGSEDFTFYALDTRNGRASWTFSTKDRIRGTPRLAHEHVFFGSDDGKVYALGALNGRFLWSFDFNAPVRSRPWVTNDLVIVGGESGEIIAISLSGQRKWSYRTKRGVISSPLVDAEGMCYVGSQDGFMYALDSNNGFNAWRFRTTGPIISSPVLHKGLLYFGSADGYFYAINSQNAREKWKYKVDKPIVASPLIYQDVVYFGGTDGIFYALDADTGNERWRYRTGGAFTSAPTVANDILLIGPMDHTLYAFPYVNL